MIKVTWTTEISSMEHTFSDTRAAEIYAGGILASMKRMGITIKSMNIDTWKVI